jgi:GNAT superfamily N-acetyltransferase
MSGESFRLVASGIETGPLLERLRADPELWLAETGRQNYAGSAHRESQAIFLRWCKEKSVAAAFTDIEAVDCPAAEKLMPEAGQVFDAALNAIADAEYPGRSMITRLAPWGRVYPHSDEGAYAEHYDRFHLCLSADEGSVFNVGSESFTAKPGELWWFNHKREHSVENKGAVDRVHMIIDAVSPSHRARRGVYYQREAAQFLWEEGWPLGLKHWAEIAHYKDIPMAPDVDTYNRLEAAGALRCFTVRDSGKLIGYAAFMVQRHLHYDIKYAAQDVLFVDEAHRAGRTGYKLIRFSEERLRAEGVALVTQHVKKTNNVGRLLERMGYEEVDAVYAKRLDRAQA